MLYKLNQSGLENTCHSKHRFDCYKKEKELLAIKKESNIMFNDNLWNGSEQCLKAALIPIEPPSKTGSGNYLSVSLFAIFVFLLYYYNY